MNTTLPLFLPSTLITELDPLLLDDLPHSVVVDVLRVAVLDVELLGKDWQTCLVSQDIRHGEGRLVVPLLTKLGPVLTNPVSVAENLPDQQLTSAH